MERELSVKLLSIHAGRVLEGLPILGWQKRLDLSSII